MVMPWWHCERGIKIDAPGKMVLPSVHTTRTMGMGEELGTLAWRLRSVGANRKERWAFPPPIYLLMTDLARTNDLHIHDTRTKSVKSGRHAN